LFGAFWVSAVAGVVVALLLVPFVAAVGIGAKSGADDFLDLPANLTVLPLIEPSRIVDAQGNEIATLVGEQYREVVPLSRVPQVMRQAIIDIEDSRFYQHDGLDYKGLIRAYLTNRENGSVTQGGSTLTQQYVKNVLLQSATTPELRKAATEQTVNRKLREARYALYLEEHLSKDEILDRYLNIAYFGDGAYGIQAAAKRYFNVEVEALTLTQAAVLAGLVKNPTSFNPALHPQAATTRRDLVLDRMHELGHADTGAWKAAKAAPIQLNQPPHSADPCTDSHAPFFCAQVRQMLLKDRTFAPTEAAAQRLLFNGGLTIRTTLEPVAQSAADSAAKEVVPVGNRVAAGVATVQPGTGNVLALAVNRAYGETADGQAPATTTDFVHTKEIYPTKETSFSPGSTFKTFALAAALEQHLPLTTTFMAPQCYKSGVFPNPQPKDCYSNADPNEAGFFSLTTATWHSVNTYYIQLAEKVGILKIAEMARRLGVTSCRVQEQQSNLRPDSPCHEIEGIGRVDGSSVIGSNEISTLDLATAYATIAARGRRCDPRFILSITQRVGGSDRPLPFSHPAGCQQVLDPQIADTVSAVLQGVITSGTAAANGQIGRPAAGKTGTAEDFSAASFVGYIPQLATAVTLADPRGPATHTLRNVLGDPHVYGGDFPTQIWARTMTRTIAGFNLPVQPLPLPDTTQPQVPKKVVPDVRGQTAELAQYFLSTQGFNVTMQPVIDPGPVGIVLGTSPQAGTEIALDQPVTLFVSGGLTATIQQPGTGQPPGPLVLDPGRGRGGGGGGGGGGRLVGQGPNRTD
jgi:membrane peptidoglycan carboxypeptidase